ncbi:MAG: aminoacyl-tRNA hydrolase [Chitinivibrionales bacterium]|nr:aminoacyl-tRNA hydrolase [Chitinivibrionales bacterium]
MNALLFFFEKFRRRAEFTDCDYIFFGLGNPGKKYRRTRHNIGFMVLDLLAGRLGAARRGRLRGATVVTGLLGGKKVALVKPLSFVNKSGDVLKAVLAAGGAIDRTIVIVDDFNIVLGTLRLRSGGSAGGHNGLKSCIAAVGEGFGRLRVGIGPLPAGKSVIDFVLGDFEVSQCAAVTAAIERAAEALVYLCENGFNAAMNAFNR